MHAPRDTDLEVSAAEAWASACPEHPLIDIRDDNERSAGTPRGARVLSTGALLAQTASSGYVICAEGVRSLKAVRELHRTGRTGFRSVAGGYQAWLAAGLPVTAESGMDATQLDRYSRHLVMPQVGPAGQQKLLGARVLLAGLGGLNSPAALYLAAAGVGTLGLADHDRVERSNLQRQVLHGEGTVGSGKTESAMGRLRDLNPDIRAVAIEERIDEGNAADIVGDWDIVVDGTDNFTARYALNDACIRHARPMVYGAVMRFQGQVSVFWPAGGAEQPCFRCLMPEAPPAADAPACSEAGVLGVLPGIVGTLQATEALKLALGIGRPLTGRLLLFDALTMEFREMRIPRRTTCASCG